MRLALALALAVLVAACGPAAEPPKRDVLLATTTSFQDSGLLELLLDDFTRKTGYRVKATAVGSGAAIALGARGEADVVVAHSAKAEEDFMAQGHGARRLLVMHNDFVILGPRGDPAGARGKPALDVLRGIARARATFISRGDKSGTDVFEKDLWQKAGIAPAAPWYVEAATGMGQTLLIASEKSAYTISDRATYLARRSGVALDIVAEKEPPLLNFYHVMTVDPKRHPAVNAAGADAFADYLVSPATQALIATFGTERYGEPLFFPDAR